MTSYGVPSSETPSSDFLTTNQSRMISTIGTASFLLMKMEPDQETDEGVFPVP
jgi:hypothetical protein